MTTSNQFNCTDILKLSLHGVWITSTVATKFMLSKFVDWSSNGENSATAASDLVKRVSVWQSCVSRFDKQLEQSILKCDSSSNQVPFFALDVFDNHKLRELESHPDQSIFDLTVELLSKASQSLNDCLRLGLGPKTSEYIGKWFCVMKTVKNCMTPHTSTSSLNGLVNEIRRYRGLEQSNRESTSNEEYLFFNHEILFFLVMHMVSFFTCTEQDNDDTMNVGDQRVKKLVVDMDTMANWEYISGCIVSQAFNLSTHGLTVSGDNQHPFAIINLPYANFKEKTRQNRGTPPVLDMHLMILGQMISSLHSLSYNPEGMFMPGNIDLQELSNLNSLFESMKKAFKRVNSTICGREKFRRFYRKNRPKYSPIHPSFFQRDMFVMGTQSYFYLFTHPLGETLREIQSLSVVNTVRL